VAAVQAVDMEAVAEVEAVEAVDVAAVAAEEAVEAVEMAEELPTRPRPNQKCLYGRRSSL